MIPLRASLAAALLVSCASGAAAAVQASDLRGRVLDGQGSPLAGLEVALHRVTPAGGAIVARTTSAADGSFTLAVPASAEGAIFFAATRVNGRLYIGEVFRAVPGTLYDIVAAGPGIQAPGSAGPPAPGASGGATVSRWPLAAGVGLLLLSGLALAVRSARRDARGARRRRTLLLELASLDEAYEGREDAPSPQEREQYLRRRARLEERLRSAAARAR